MRVLVGCEFSGIVRDAFRARGHDAYSCDILRSDGDNYYHLQCDVKSQLKRKWDLAIFHPPCTYLCNSGVCWLHKDKERWEHLRQANLFFYELLNAPIDRIAIENPIPHKYGLLPKYTQVIQPWQFGHGETKATCLWLKNLPKLVPANIVEGRVQRLHRLPPSKDRSKLRSTTYKGIAEAFAEQWGKK